MSYVKSIILLISLLFYVQYYSQQSNSKILEFDSLIKVSKNQALDNPRISINSAEKALQIANDLGESQKKAKALNLLSVAYIYKSEYDSSIHFLESLILESKSLCDSGLLRTAFTNLGVCYDHKGLLDSAIHVYSKALRIAEEMKSSKQALIRSNLGALYLEIDDLEIALSYFEESFKIAKSNNDSLMCFGSKLNEGLIYLETNKFIDAIHSLNVAKSHCPVEYFEYNMSSYHTNMGKLRYRQQKYDQAFMHFQKCIDTQKQYEDFQGLAESYYFLALIDRNTKRTNPIKFAQISHEFSRKTGNLLHESNAKILLHELYLEIQDSVKAYEYFSTGLQLIDSFQNDRIQTVAIKHHLKLENQKLILAEGLATSIKMNRIEWEKNRNRILLSTLGILILLVSLILWKNYRNRTSIEQKYLLDQIEYFRNELERTKSNIQERINVQLDKMPKGVRSRLNETDVKVLQIIIDNPLESNDDIATKVFRSKEGVTSSLRKMYRLFKVPDTRNKKVSLVLEISKMAFESNQD